MITKVKRLFSYFIVCSLPFISSCKKEHMLDCFKNSGKTISVERAITNFNTIDMKNNVDVNLHFGNSYSLKVTAGENLINGIITEIKDSVLYIKNENKCNWVRSFSNKYIVDITTIDLVNIVNWGTGNATFKDTLTNYEFVYDSWGASGTMNFLFNGNRILTKIHTGTADVTITGSAALNYIYLFGYGFMNCKNLKAKSAFIVNKGSGNCTVKVTDELHAEIESLGNIYYAGNPYSINSIITGTGQLIHQ